MQGIEETSPQTLSRQVFGLAAFVPGAIALLGITFLGCGGGGKPSPASTTRRSQAVAGGEKSIEDFGREAMGADRDAILAAEQSYFNAVSSKGYAAACSHLASPVKRSLTELAAHGSSGNCAAVMPALFAPQQAYATMHQQASGVVKRVRIEGSRAFVVFHAQGARLYQMPLSRENGQWKVGLLTSAVLVPSPSTLRG